jgi:lipoprotein-anchoring transpeptidase ErfK/SrfK
VVLHRFRLVLVTSLVLAGATLVPQLEASAATTYRVSATFPTTLNPNLPLLRLHFAKPTKATSLPALSSKPAISSVWQQIGPNDVQAVATSTLRPSINYTFSLPTSVTCAKHCTFIGVRPHATSSTTNFVFEAQLLAELHYLPLTFTPATAQTSLATQTNGTFAWAYPNLPPTLSAQWQLGTDNVILRGALETFQSQMNLPLSGEADSVTWSDLLTAATADKVDPASYNYVDVSETYPETLNLYVAGKDIFHTLVNTGITAAPTATGTYPVYSRFVSTTMSGFNPDGTPYHDPDIPWVSYFNGGDALHGFIRSTYGWQQSLGCVEMPFASAKVVFPYTPIGTLVTVRP